MLRSEELPTLSASRMVGASNEYIMATLIHEVYHAQRAIVDPPTPATLRTGRGYSPSTSISYVAATPCSIV